MKLSEDFIQLINEGVRKIFRPVQKSIGGARHL